MKKCACSFQKSQRVGGMGTNSAKIALFSESDGMEKLDMATESTDQVLNR
ncbi:MAG TPA: hypothetical protein VL983_06475 [Terriglobales bacterium]|nr:hypothetical protein [Terriglobales bacterium]